MSTVAENEDWTPDAGVTVSVEGKQFGRGNKTLFPNFQMALPAEWNGTTII